jgi:hypothetical protein
MLCCNCGKETAIAKVRVAKYLNQPIEENLCWMCIEQRVNIEKNNIYYIKFIGYARKTDNIIYVGGKKKC